MDALANDIVIYRATDSGTPKQIKVTPLYGDRTRMFKSIENPGNTVVLPALVVSQSGFVRDPSRVSGIHDFISEIPDITKLDAEEYEKYFNFYTPIPINIEYTVEIVAKYMEDFDQIMSNFIPFCNPSFYVVQRHPKLPGKTLKSQVVWSGTCTQTQPNAITSTDAERFYATTQFTFKTWMFAGSTAQPNLEDKLIHRINFYPEIVGRDGIYTLSNFFAVDTKMSFGDFQNRLLLGKIDYPENVDLFMMSSNMDSSLGSGVVCGMWSGISAYVSGDSNLDEVIAAHGDPTYLTVDGRTLLLFGNSVLVNDAVENMTIDQWLKSVNLDRN